jgi:hypothetical protein
MSGHAYKRPAHSMCLVFVWFVFVNLFYLFTYSKSADALQRMLNTSKDKLNQIICDIGVLERKGRAEIITGVTFTLIITPH